MRLWWVAALTVACHRKSPDPNQITTQLVDASPPVAVLDASTPEGLLRGPCAEPSKITLVGTLPKHAYFYLDVLTDNKLAYDPETLASRPLVYPPSLEPTQDGGVALVPIDGGIEVVPLPATARLLGQDIQNGRWLPIYINRGATGVIDLTTNKRIPGDFLDVNGDHARTVKGGETIVIDLRSRKEVFRHKSCPPFSRFGSEGLSKRGRFLECYVNFAMATLFYLDDPARAPTSLDRANESMSPAEDYVVGVPVTAYDEHTNARSALAWRPLPGVEKPISSDVEPAEPESNMNVIFCGEGELFAAYGERPGLRPRGLGVYRGSDGKLLASAPALGRPPRARAAHPQSVAQFDRSGAHIVPTIGEDPTMTSATTNESFVYRLER